MKKKKFIYREQYLIRLNYLKPDGYWVYGHEEYILVPILPGMTEKCNHKKAEAMIIDKYKHTKFKIVAVMYC